MGGLWALWLALDRPERVSSLALLGYPALLLDAGAPFGFRLLGVRGLNRLLFRLQPPSLKQAQRILEQVYGKPAAARMPPEFVEVQYRSELIAGAGDAFRTLLELTIGVRGWAAEWSLGADELGRIEQPAVFVWGEDDVFAGPEYGRRACEVMRDARLEVIPGGHCPWWDDPPRCGELVSAFLRSPTPVA